MKFALRVCVALLSVSVAAAPTFAKKKNEATRGVWKAPAGVAAKSVEPAPAVAEEPNEWRYINVHRFASAPPPPPPYPGYRYIPVRRMIFSGDLALSARGVAVCRKAGATVETGVNGHKACLKHTALGDYWLVTAP